VAYLGLGKFSSALEELIFTLASSEQWAEHEDGNSTDWDLYFWTLPIRLPDLQPVELQTVQRLATEIDPEDTELWTRVSGFWLVTENSQGFAGVTDLESPEALDRAYAELQAAYAAWDSQDAEEQA
jgi:hypothetical protein